MAIPNIPFYLIVHEGLRHAGRQIRHWEEADLPVATGEFNRLKTSFVINANIAMTRYYSWHIIFCR